MPKQLQVICSPDDLKGTRSKKTLKVKLFVQGMRQEVTVRDCIRYFGLLETMTAKEAREYLRGIRE